MATLILGATGFIGRNLVTYMAENNSDGQKIVAADKVLPDTAFLGDHEKKAFEKVTFTQKNLINAGQVTKLFEEFGPFDYVINLAAETKYGHNEEVYAERVFNLSVICAKEAAARGVKRYIEASTAQVYDSDKKEKDESGKLAPWTLVAKYKLMVEEELKKIENLNLVIVRPAIVYGPGDRYGLAPRIICGAIYKHIKEEMKFLWNKDLKMSTVHVSDVSRALVHLCTNGENGEIYNLADKNASDQGTINTCLEEVYGIKTDFLGKMKSTLATKLGMTGLTSQVNDKHVGPWSDMCKAENITFTPLSPYLDQELLYNKSLSISGVKIESTGFTYEKPMMEAAAILEWIKYNEDANLFPKGYV